MQQSPPLPPATPRTVASQAPNDTLTTPPLIDPPEARGLPIEQLGDLVASVIPPNGFDGLSWDYLADDPRIFWQTSGVSDSGGGTTREGLVRVRVGGRKSTRLLRSLNELAWSVDLLTAEPAKYGPKSILINVGYGPNKQCFGTLDDGCTFAATEALTSPNLQTSLLCDLSSFGEQHEAFLASVPGKRDVIVLYTQSGGSGGSSSSLAILPVTERKSACSPS